jgi:adhesin transport system membrane fusion protein
MRRKTDDQDLGFMRDSVAAARRIGARGVYLASSTILLLLGGFLVWADTSQIQEVTRGRGSVVPSQRIQVVQNLEGGILRELHVAEGDRVTEGEPVATLDGTIAKSSLEELRARRHALRAAVTRLRAEADDREPQYPDWLRAQAPNVIQNEQALYRARQSDLASRIAGLEQQARQREQEVAELEKRKQQIAERLEIARQELETNRPLAERGLVPRIDMLGYRREVRRLEGELRTVRMSIPRARLAARQARKKIEQTKLEHRRDSAQKFAEKLTELKVVEKRIDAREDRVTRRVVKSPVRGRVKEIHTSTIGGAVKPGQDIAEIVPIGDSLLVEARIKPNDIAFVEEGQEAIVKVTAYDYSVYGGLAATVETVSADTVRTEKGNAFYRVHLRTEDAELRAEGERLPIIPGMTVRVEILGGKKTVLDYLLKPITKGGQTPPGAAQAGRNGRLHPEARL